MVVKMVNGMIADKWCLCVELIQLKKNINYGNSTRLHCCGSVSYTHLDVYKRQKYDSTEQCTTTLKHELFMRY